MDKFSKVPATPCFCLLSKNLRVSVTPGVCERYAGEGYARDRVVFSPDVVWR